MGNLARNTRLLAALVLALCFVASAGGTGYREDQQILQHWNGSSWTKSNVRVPKGAIDLAAVTAISASDVWVVGTNSHGSVADPDYWLYPLAEHWNGRLWHAMRLPTPSRGTPYAIDDISAAAPNDIWAVGGAGPAYTVIEHWNGKRWRVVPDPEPLTDLSGVAALSPHDVWLVGYLNTFKHDQTGIRMLVEHWNGRTWRRVATPHPKNRLLQSVAASSPSDIWAVGGPLLLHWNGVAWKQVAYESPPAHRYSIDAVAALSADDAWAVGSAGSRSLVEHWNGHRWHVVGAASFKGSSLSAISAVSADDIWVAGTTGNPIRPFAAHWDGKSWTVVPPKNAIGHADWVTGVAALGRNDAWVVGSTVFP